MFSLLGGLLAQFLNGRLLVVFIVSIWFLFGFLCFPVSVLMCCFFLQQSYQSFCYVRCWYFVGSLLCTSVCPARRYFAALYVAWSLHRICLCPAVLPVRLLLYGALFSFPYIRVITICFKGCFICMRVFFQFLQVLCIMVALFSSH